MKNFMNIRIHGNGIGISTENIQFASSFGFAIFCNQTNENIEAEISRVERDIKLISFMEKINISEVIDIVRSSDDSNIALLGLKEKYGCSEEEAHFLLNMDLKELGNCNFNLLIDRLKTYKNLLKGFIS